MIYVGVEDKPSGQEMAESAYIQTLLLKEQGVHVDAFVFTPSQYALLLDDLLKLKGPIEENLTLWGLPILVAE